VIASRPTTLFGTTTKLPALVRIFVARHVTSLTIPSTPPIVTQWPTRNGFSIWMASPAKRLPSVSCSANPMTADRRRRDDAIRHEQRRHEHEQRDDDGVLDDLRVVVRDPVDAPRVDGEDDERVRDAEGEQQRAGDADLAADRCRQPAVGDERRGNGVDEQEQRRGPQSAADVGVHRGPAREQHGGQQDGAGDDWRHDYSLVTRE
jgi:hypothetical protein